VLRFGTSDNARAQLASLELEHEHADAEEHDDPDYSGDVSVVHVRLRDGPPP
jgi:hypothetical protein